MLNLQSSFPPKKRQKHFTRTKSEQINPVDNCYKRLRLNGNIVDNRNVEGVAKINSQ